MIVELGVCVVLSTIVSNALYQFYKWATENSDYFEKKQLKHLKANFLVGNTFGLFLKQYNLPEFFNSIYNRYPDEKFVHFGSFYFLSLLLSLCVYFSYFKFKLNIMWKILCHLSKG